jgi:5'-3' exonuclease
MATSAGPLVIIDGHNCFIRNYVRSPYRNSNGQKAGGTTGMIISVRKIISDFRASNCLVVWDGEGGSQRRRSIFSEYKAGRKVRLNEGVEGGMGETPEESLLNMRHQRNVAQEYLTMLGVPQVRCDGVEADDLMAYVAGKMDHPSGCIIVSTDQDMLQLIKQRSVIPCGENPQYHTESSCLDCVLVGPVSVYSPIKKVLYDHDRFVADYGVLPQNFRLVKALTGDASDNIKGVKGFGNATCVKSFPFLAERRVTPGEVLTAAEGIKGVLGKRLIEEKARFLENLTLVDLSEPMLSATAARQARDALRRNIGCREVAFRVRLIRDGVSFSGDGFPGVFRDFVMRRRRVLAETATTVESDAVLDGAGSGVLPEEPLAVDPTEAQGSSE